MKNKKNFKVLPLDSLVLADWNYKKFDDPEMHKKLVANIKKNGQIENIIVRDVGEGKLEVVNGNHRFLAMREAGLKEAICYNLGKISLAKAKRIAVETNETKFKADEDRLAALVNDIILEEEDFNDTNPLTDEEMKALTEITSEEEAQAEEVTQGAKKTTKTKTAVSLAGDKYTTVKIEAVPEHAHKFTDLIQRFSDKTGSQGGSLDIICKFMGKFSDEEIYTATGYAKPLKKQAKKSLKSSVSV